MHYSPKIIKRKMDQCLEVVSQNTKEYVQKPDIDFTRKRKLSFKDTIKTIFSMTSKSLRGELMDYFNLKFNIPTVSAFVQQRNKIQYRVFEDLFHNFIDLFKDNRLYKGYRLLAVDGSDIQVPTNPFESDSFHKGTNGQKPYNLIHLTALYDLLQNIYVDAIIEGKQVADERKCFTRIVDRNFCNAPEIFIADRGFESYNCMAHVIEKGQYFLIRIKDLHSSGIASGLELPDTNEFDTSVSVSLTRKQTNEAKRSPLKFIPCNTNFDYLPKKTKKSIEVMPYTLSFRVVRFKLAENTYEMLVTNLPSDIFDISELKRLYAMRWGIETSFRNLKYSLSLIFFHSKKTEYILQEIFAKLTMYNFSALITLSVAIKQKKRKLSYRINFAAAIGICRKYFFKNISPPIVEALLLQFLLPIRQSVSNSRRKTLKTAPSFIYRIS